MDKERCQKRQIRAEHWFVSIALVFAFFFCLFGSVSVPGMAEDFVMDDAEISVEMVHIPQKRQIGETALRRPGIILPRRHVPHSRNWIAKYVLGEEILRVRQAWIPLGGQAPPLQF